LALVMVVGFVLPAGTAAPAQAFGDTCHRDVTARGSVQGSMSSARGAAIDAWERAVSRKHGSRFANWYYSADRTFDCSWNTGGNRITCVATAGPCGRKR
jgi:hypothetical protein